MTESQSTNEYNVILAFNQSVLGNSTLQNSTTGDVCAGAGTYSDGTCRTVWPFWVEVTVPLCCVLFFLLTLAIVYLRPVGPASETDSSKQQLNADDKERTERDPSVSYGLTDKTSLDTKV